ncbi:uncharacterized protein LOC133744829 [Rosa rugosa]|uniref:uncharacterized protein LOC133744829 n=1 Tax=Rosa rugosa TaxID=74645 RepID=UPI002B4071AF|nr:uncharacterized protein LOC133744829 [Rosa rugosa]
MCIPLSRNVRSDRITWKLERKGFYSVKSAYWVARDIVLDNLRVSTSVGDPFDLLWKALWHARVPGKVHICLWQACNNLLPTRDRLTTKGYTGELGCLLCSHPYEDSRHVFCACPVAKEILGAALFNLPLSMSHSFSFKEWMLEQATTMSSDIFAKLLMTVWALWKNRNEKLWSEKSQSAVAISLGTMTWYESFLLNRYPNGRKQKGRAHQFWKAPQAVGYGTVGGVIRNDQGGFVAAIAHQVSHVTAALHIELVAIRAGMDLCQAMMVDKVIIESDCLVAIQAITSEVPDMSVYSPLIEDIKVGARVFQDISFVHAPRSANCVAHRLASHAFENEGSFEWFAQAPELILDAIMYDCNHRN